jgi:deazaflavin-dependent oxidoreductase (nitroreductase family)
VKDATARRLSRVHTTLFRATGGRIGRRLVRNDMLLLTTTGRHTGEAHTVPLLYLRDDPRLIVFASWGGRDVHPEWYLNLVAHPGATVEVLKRRFEVVASPLEGDERLMWWQRAQAAYDGYTEYQSRTDRQIPVVALDPASRPG